MNEPVIVSENGSTAEGKTARESGDEEALRKLVSTLENAWNSGDSLGWTAQFATDADFIHILGGHFSGHNSIERGHRAIFDTIYKGSTNRYTVQKIRLLAPNIALVFVLAELKVTQPGLPPLIQARPTLAGLSQLDHRLC
ncbi:MAG TPA: SgcJ/EcaC family oxidoreductase [Verrucomicrobiae bacterium]|nr:SgcJ/EcaC family oxidoreductase [Verrucomicrobiae bacterium]